jgi:hypothetical protein
MPYNVTISGFDLSDGLMPVRIAAGYTWVEVGGPSAVVRRQESVTLDVPAVDILRQTTPVTFSYAGDLAPQPSPAWFIALWIQEVPRIPSGTGWLFKSGGFTTTEPTSDPIEIIVAPEQLIGAAELAGAIGAFPVTQGSTTITSVSLAVSGADIALTAVGTDTGLPSGVTFTYTATLKLIPNGNPVAVDTPFDVELDNPSLSFTAGTGTGFVTFLLNVIAGLIYNEVEPRVRSTVEGRLNAGVLSSVATRLNRGVPTTMPTGVVLSIRSVRPLTRPLDGGGTEPVIGVRAALGAFGGVLSKFPAASGRCFIASAATSPHAPEVRVLQAWRDEWLRPRRGGPAVIGAYERLSPPFARFVARSDRRRALTRGLVVSPAARCARHFLRRNQPDDG